MFFSKSNIIKLLFLFSSSFLFLGCQNDQINLDKKNITPLNDIFSAKEGPDSTGSIGKERLTEKITDNINIPTILREGPDSTGSKPLIKLFLKVSNHDQLLKNLDKTDIESIEIIYQTETFKIKNDEIEDGKSLDNDQLVHLVFEANAGLNLFSAKKDLPEQLKINLKGKSIPILIPITSEIYYKTLLASVNFENDDFLELYLDINDEGKEANTKKLYSEFRNKDGNFVLEPLANSKKNEVPKDISAKSEKKSSETKNTKPKKN